MVFGKLLARRRPQGRTVNGNLNRPIDEHKPPSPVKIVVDDLNNAIFPIEDRYISIARAHRQVDHTVPAKHDEEVLEYKAANAIYVKLAFAVATKASDEEIRRLADLLELVHKCNVAALAVVYDEIGWEVIPLLVKLLQLPFDAALLKHKAAHSDTASLSSSSNDMLFLDKSKSLARAGLHASTDVKLAVQRVCKVLVLYAQHIPHCPTYIVSQPHLLQALLHVMERRHHMTTEAQCSALAILCNLAQCEQNRIVMASEPDLLDGICRMAHDPSVLKDDKNWRTDAPVESIHYFEHGKQPQGGHHRDDDDDDDSDVNVSTSAMSEGTRRAMKQVAAMTLMHLSYGSSDSVPLADSPIMLDTYASLLRTDPNEFESRRHAAIGLYNLACGDANTVALVQHAHVLETLLRIVSHEDEDAELRTVCVETLYNLSCSQEVPLVPRRLTTHFGLVLGLGSLLRFKQQAPERVQHVAAMTLYRLSQVTTHDDHDGHGLLLSALVQASLWTNTAHIAQAFEIQAQLRIEQHAIIMTHHSGVLQALATQALLDGKDDMAKQIRRSAIHAVILLASVDENKPILAQQEGIMLALTRASFDPSHVMQGRTEEERNFGEQIQGVHAILKDLVEEL